MQVLLSGYVNKRQEILSDIGHLQLFLNEFTDLLNMQTKGSLKYELFDSVNDDPSLGGISAVQFIYTSSITLHTYPEYNFLDIDIFSCQYIDDSAVIWFIQQVAMDTVDYVVLPMRGTFVDGVNSNASRTRIPIAATLDQKGSRGHLIV
jgi:S-adenosylmethionine/arginine decarboxylase-like enzyme